MKNTPIQKPKSSKAPIVLCLLILMAASSATALNKITIATIGGSMSAGKGKTHGEMVTQLTDYWRRQLSNVLKSKVDLIVLPEHSDAPTGMSYAERREYIKVRGDKLLEYFASVAKAHHCYIAFGSVHMENNVVRNSVIVLDREGKVAGTYHKNFPTVYEMEAGIRAGSEISIVQCDFGKVALAVCFDLNFDELREAYAKAKPDIILFSSVYHGGLMQGIWAYSCRAYFVGAIGTNGLPSEIRNPFGEVIASSTNYFNYTVATVNLDYEVVHLDYNWDKLLDLKAKYGSAVTIHDPGKVGAVLITSEDKDTSAAQMVREFNIELLDDYFNRSRAERNKQLQMFQ